MVVPAASPKAIELSIDSFVSGDLDGQLLKPVLAVLQWRDVCNASGAGPYLAFHVLDKRVAYGDDLSAGAPKGVYLVEDRLLNNAGLEKDKSTIPFGGERAVRDEQFIQDIEFAKLPERITGADGGLQIPAKPIKSGWAIDSDLGVARLPGEEVDVPLDIRGVGLELIRKELGRAARSIREHTTGKAGRIQAAGWFGAFFDAVELVSGAHPLVAEDGALAISGLEDDVCSSDL